MLVLNLLKLVLFKNKMNRLPSEFNTCRLIPKPVCGGMASGGCIIVGGSEGGRG